MPFSDSWAHLFDTVLSDYIFNSIALMLGEEGIRAELEVLQSVILPHIDYLTWYLLVRNLSSNFDNEVLNDFDHEVTILAGCDLFRHHEALHFLNGH